MRTSSTKVTYSGLDGTGVGIAIVDSGVMKAHKGFNDGNGVTRVKKNVQFLTTNLADWVNGYDSNTSLQPGSAELACTACEIGTSSKPGRPTCAGPNRRSSRKSSPPIWT